MHTDPSPPLTALRLNLIAFCVFAALLISLFFYGVGFNHLFLVLVSVALFAAFLLSGPVAFQRWLAADRVGATLVAVSLLGLCLVQVLGAISPETSFSGGFIVGAAPAAYGIARMHGAERQRALMANPRQLVSLPALALGILAIMVLISAVRFLGWQERTQEPLADPTSFAMLVYLGLVPWLHRHLAGPADTAVRAGTLFKVAAAAALGSLAVFSTASRAASALFLAVVVGWVVLVLLRRARWRPVLAVVLATAVSWGTVSALSVAFQEAVGQELASDSALEQRRLLLRSAATLASDAFPHGLGLYGYDLRYPAVRSLQEQTSGGRFVHNDYVQFAVEGGIWLLVPLLFFLALVVVQGLLSLRTPPASERWLRAGGWVALGCVLVHAAVTYVFYTLSLALAIGLLAGWSAAANPDQPAGPAVRRGSLIAWLAALGLGIWALGLLALENVTLGVFSGQPSLPGTSQLRVSVDRQLQFARTAQRLNSDRSTPVVVQALHLKRRFLENSEPSLYAAAEAALQEVLAINPYAEQSRIEYADLLARSGAGRGDFPLGLRLARQLLDQGLALDPASLKLLTTALRLVDATGTPEDAYGFMTERIAPWLELLSIRFPEQAGALTEDLIARARALGETADLPGYRQRLEAIERRLAAPKPGKVWLMRWREGLADRASPVDP
jgi:O-antigen ligase